MIIRTNWYLLFYSRCESHWTGTVQRKEGGETKKIGSFLEPERSCVSR